MGEFSVWHWLIVIGVFVVLFGSAKLPQAARSLGRSMRIFKSETKGLMTDDGDSAEVTMSVQQMREEAARLRQEAAGLEQQAPRPQELKAPDAARQGD
ncbi:Sec-independent protein translocase subunit TatA [Actinoallomurus sp. CA-150999]|uniref:Sec-independent protein translocase subunit TatA n=1 Tax=Actinoallomurus sp. CA-150999 TaxID=3239887 RepID=UPI003D8CDA24